MKTVDEFWRRVDQTLGEDECWRWMGPKAEKGYGLLYWHGRQIGAHVLAYDLTNPGRTLPYVLHTCDYPPCCNPKHLFEGTPQMNMDDMMAKGRGRGMPNAPSQIKHGSRKGSRPHLCEPV